jgi:hypothetical protein
MYCLFKLSVKERSNHVKTIDNPAKASSQRDKSLEGH